uniref:Protein ABHD14A n=1 Tax=Scylla olivacea TaxID=85551 RepID=A0A0P4WAI7_SCYOL
MAPSLLLTKMPMTPLRRDTSGRTMADPSFWHTFDFQSESIPPAVVDAASKVTVITNNINIMGANTFYREAKPPAEVEPSGEVVLLLHGAAFKSANWVELNTVNLLAGMGHRVIAVDLPGYGESKQATVEDKAGYLLSLLTHLDANKPILVSPSMSGGFSIPFITQNPESLSGYVPVAPVGTKKGRAKYRELQVPTLIIYGEKDTGLGHLSRDDLSNIPTSQAVELPGARHPAYLDQTNIFHTLLYNFIKQVHAHRAVV